MRGILLECDELWSPGSVELDRNIPWSSGHCECDFRSIQNPETTSDATVKMAGKHGKRRKDCTLLEEKCRHIYIIYIRWCVSIHQFRHVSVVAVWINMWAPYWPISISNWGFHWLCRRYHKHTCWAFSSHQRSTHIISPVILFRHIRTFPTHIPRWVTETRVSSRFAGHPLWL